MDKGELTAEERKAVMALADAWNLFAKLPEQHPMERDEFCRAIHTAQSIVMCRPVARNNDWIRK